MEYALRFSFPTTNNEAEYEAMILELRLVKSLGLEEIVVRGDSKLVIDQIRGCCGVKKETLMRYHAKAVEISMRIIFKHILRAKNERQIDCLDSLPLIIASYHKKYTSKSVTNPFTRKRLSKV
ncbi:hypothetical protein LIER_37768 [Lithospermum erythrorhizon]|uniref:RNase H type-1 domain-containing protein n=1 Tax=Lithospermum erythrorhizon TaxID=34254 RepID=A0AAV3PS85_LITER